MDVKRCRVEVYKKMEENDWDSTAIALDDISGVNITAGMGKIKDNFNFNILNSGNRFFKTYHNGDGATVAFTLTWYIPSLNITTGARREKVYVYNSDTSSWDLQTYTTDYSISGTTLTFVSAPASGTRNIRIDYSVIEADDLIKIYFWKDSTWAGLSSAQQAQALSSQGMEGIVTNPKNTIDANGSIIQVKGKSWIETLFETMILLDATGYTVAEAIGGSAVDAAKNGVLDRQQLYNDNRKIYWHPDNPTVKSTGAAFPTVGYTAKYKSAIDCLEELSQNKYTEDGQYVFYVKIGDSNQNASEVDGRYYLVWDVKAGTSASTITEGTDDLEKVVVDKYSDDIINVILYNAGKDCYNHNIHYLRFDDTSLAALGAKWKYITMADIAEQLVDDEFAADTGNTWWTSVDTDADGRKIRQLNFPDAYNPGGQQYTMQFKARDSKGTVTATSLQPSSNSDFNDYIRTEAKWVGFEKAGPILDVLSVPRFKAIISIPRPDGIIAGDTTYTLGSLIKLVIARNNFNRTLRINQITTDFWSQRVELIEDEESALARATEVDTDPDAE